MTSTVEKSSRSHLVERLLEIVRKRPGITVRELADELASMDDIESVRSLSTAFQLVLAECAHASDDESQQAWLSEGWGPAPTLAEVDSAKQTGREATTAAREALLADALTRDQAAAALSISPQAISDRVLAGRLVGSRRGREWRFPVWQFGDEGTLPGLDRLIAAWPGTSLALSTWASRPSPDLGERTPASELLSRGGLERVLAVVDSIAAAAW